MQIIQYIVNPYKMMEKAENLVTTYTHMHTYRKMGGHTDHMLYTSVSRPEQAFRTLPLFSTTDIHS